MPPELFPSVNNSERCRQGLSFFSFFFFSLHEGFEVSETTTPVRIGVFFPFPSAGQLKVYARRELLLFLSEAQPVCSAEPLRVAFPPSTGSCQKNAYTPPPFFFRGRLTTARSRGWFYLGPTFLPSSPCRKKTLVGVLFSFRRKGLHRW